MKIQRISEYQHRLGFQNLKDQFQVYRASFLRSDLGKLYQAIPWQELVKVFGLTDKLKGPKSIFSPRGKIALMFLKHHAACSDRKMIEQLNGNLDYQYFCDICLSKHTKVKTWCLLIETGWSIVDQTAEEYNQ